MKDAAKEQAKAGIITWKQFREFCAEVDRIKRARLSAAREAAALSDAEVRRHGEHSATDALMRQRHTGNTRNTHLDRSKKSGESGRVRLRAAVIAALRAEPQLSDREHARRLGVDHKTVASVRRGLQESGEIPTFLRRVDPRTGRLSQPSRRAVRPATFAAEAVAN
ncbi:helix-turn-helix domain-containing protein [Mycolicibacterium elephantis]